MWNHNFHKETMFVVCIFINVYMEWNVLSLANDEMLSQWTHTKLAKGSAFLSVSSKFKSNTGQIVRGWFKTWFSRQSLPRWRSPSEWVCDFWALLTIAGTRDCSQSGTCCHHPPRISHSAECTVLLTVIKQNKINLLLKITCIKINRIEVS